MPSGRGRMGRRTREDSDRTGSSKSTATGGEEIPGERKKGGRQCFSERCTRVPDRGQKIPVCTGAARSGKQFSAECLASGYQARANHVGRNYRLPGSA